MEFRERANAEDISEHVRGKLQVHSDGQAWQDVLLTILSHRSVEENIIVPAVPEPMIVWILSGSAVIEEREIDGEWIANTVVADDFFLTASTSPYEMRWHTRDGAPFEVMHLYLGLSVLDEARRELYGDDASTIRLRDVSGGRDPAISALLGQLYREMTAPHAASRLFVRGIAQSLAVHLLRTYGERSKAARRAPALPAARLRRVTDLMEAHLDEGFELARLASEAGMSPSHFSRLFKRATSFSPSQYFIRLRMTKARRLLRDTERSVIDIGMEVGYSSPSHFAQIFRREIGISPTDYRG